MGRPHGHLPRQAKGCQDDTQSFHQAQALAMQAMQAMHSSHLITSHYYHWPMFQVLTHWWGLFTALQNDNSTCKRPAISLHKLGLSAKVLPFFHRLCWYQYNFHICPSFSCRMSRIVHVSFCTCKGEGVQERLAGSEYFLGVPLKSCFLWTRTTTQHINTTVLHDFLRITHSNLGFKPFLVLQKCAHPRLTVVKHRDITGIEALAFRTWPLKSCRLPRNSPTSYCIACGSIWNWIHQRSLHSALNSQK
jgi:hypothetical protein